MKTFSFSNKFGIWVMGIINSYNHNKYWKRRNIVTDPQNKTSLFLKLYYLWRIKRTDSKKLCSFGTNLNSGSKFETPPLLPHGPNGIIVGHDIHIGRNVTIFQQVTIAHGGGRIGDYVMIGAGAKILSGVNIGHHSKIGANAVVVEDVTPYSTVVLQKPRIITKI